MRKILPILLTLLGAAAPLRGAGPEQSASLKVLQLNIWHEGTMVEGGFEAIVEAIVRTEADLVFLSEVRNYHQTPFVPRLTAALRERGRTYHGNEPTTLDVGILSRHPLCGQTVIFPDGAGSGSILKVLTSVGRDTIAAYAAHLNYTHYACYLPRGYDGLTWKKLEAPVADADSVMRANRRSWRDESIRIFLQAARADIAAKRPVVLGGDFNEPSHLDWGPESRNRWDHNGLVIGWDCSTMLYEQGFRDAYRTLFPDVLTHPGFTFPSDNPGAPVEKLTWAPEADERDRIDFVYYYPSPRLIPQRACIVGPEASVVRGQRTKESTSDPFLLPAGGWPSDHKGVWVEFLLPAAQATEGAR